MNGPMLEAKEGCAFLDDIDPDTFVRFCEYAYTGDYGAPAPDLIVERAEGINDAEENPSSAVHGVNGAEDDVADSPAPEYVTTNVEEHPLADAPVAAQAEEPFFGEPVAEEPIAEGPIAEEPIVEEPIRQLNDIWSSFGSKKGKKGKAKSKKAPVAWGKAELDAPIAWSSQPSRRQQLWNSFTDKTRATPAFNSDDHDSWKDYTEIFLSHARLYTFADRYQIDPLAKLTVDKLRDTLTDLEEIHLGHLTSITKLLEYTYDNENTRDRVDDGADALDQLRDLVIHYTTCVVEHFRGVEEFEKLLAGDGVLGRDLVISMMRRLS